LPGEYLEMLFEIAVEEAERLSWVLLADFGKILPESWLKVAQAAGAAKRDQLTAEILKRLSEPEILEKFSEEQAKEVKWMGDMIAHGKRSEAPDPDKISTISLGVIDYRSIDYVRASKNIGDFVQTVACLSNLARFRNTRFSGDEGLAQFVTGLKDRVYPDRHIEGPPVDINLVATNRDYTSRSGAPAGTWLIAFGWHMHSLFNAAYDFPFDDSLRPIFFSFHINNPDLLTDEVIAYLKSKAPIGCRDWNTVDMLFSHGVDAFFSGCLTTTVDNILRGSRKSPSESAWKVAFVNVPPAPEEKATPYDTINIMKPEILERTFSENLAAAVEQLEEYARYDLLVSSKLHCYLPSTAMGLKVDFRPKRPADIRFEGLYGLDPKTIETVRQPILRKLQLIFEKIFTGAAEEEVYSYWREVCAPDVERARAYCQPPPPAPPSFDIQVAADRVLSAWPSDQAGEANGDYIEVAFSTDENLKDQLLVVLESAVAHTSRPIRAWILSRGLGPDDFARYEKLFPQIRFRFLPCDSVDYGQILGLLIHTTVATMDRLLLPVLVPAKKMIYLDIDLLVRADLAELFDIPMGESPLAGRTSMMESWSTGYHLVYRSANRLDAARSIELRRRMHALHDLRFPGFNAGVLLLNLDQMRKDRFCEEYLPFAERYGMNDQEVLNCYAGDRRIELDLNWNCLAAQDMIDHAKIIHWAGHVKAWNCNWVVGKNYWDYHEAKVRARLAQES
ncbi:MAG TPA: glycosyltransferase, partial [Chthoniobacterales bacterium]